MSGGGGAGRGAVERPLLPERRLGSSLRAAALRLAGPVRAGGRCGCRVSRGCGRGLRGAGGGGGGAGERSAAQEDEPALPLVSALPSPARCEGNELPGAAGGSRGQQRGGAGEFAVARSPRAAPGAGAGCCARCLPLVSAAGPAAGRLPARSCPVRQCPPSPAGPSGLRPARDALM